MSAKITLKVEALEPLLEVYWAESDSMDVGCLFQLHRDIKTNPWWKSFGFLFVAPRRSSNSSQTIPNDLIVRILPKDSPSTSQSRFNWLTYMQRFSTLNTKPHFNFKFIVDASSDVTKSTSSGLRSANRYLNDNVIFRIIENSTHSYKGDIKSFAEDIKKYWKDDLITCSNLSDDSSCRCELTDDTSTSVWTSTSDSCNDSSEDDEEYYESGLFDESSSETSSFPYDSTYDTDE